MHVHLSNSAAVAFAACYAAVDGLLLPSLVVLSFSEDARSALVPRAMAAVAVLTGLGLILADFVINVRWLFMSEAAKQLYGAVAGAVVFSNIAASTWISQPSDGRRLYRKSVCIALCGLTAVLLLGLLPQAWGLLNS